MSHFAKMSISAKTKYEKEMLTCLREYFGESYVEVHEVPQEIMMWNGVKSGNQANIIVRRKGQEAKAGRQCLTNDFGLKREEDGTYTIYVDKAGFSEKEINKVMQQYATKVSTKVLTNQGYTVSKSYTSDGKVKLSAIKMVA
jgi:hypothetical protein